MKGLAKYKGIISAIIIFVLAIWAYKLYFPSEIVLEEEGVQVTELVGSDLVANLIKLQTVRFDETLFSEPAYQALTDFSVSVPTQPLGRPNPFAPI